MSALDTNVKWILAFFVGLIDCFSSAFNLWTILPIVALKDDGIFLSGTRVENLFNWKKTSVRNKNEERSTYLSGTVKEKGNTCLPLPMTSVPGTEINKSLSSVLMKSCYIKNHSISINYYLQLIILTEYFTILSRLSQDVMFDIIIFLISPVHMMVMLPVMFTPANPSFSLCYENKRLDFSFLWNLHNNPSIDGVSICEGVSAVDGIIFNQKIFDGHFSQKGILSGKSKSPVKPGRTSNLVRPVQLLSFL